MNTARSILRDANDLMRRHWRAAFKAFLVPAFFVLIVALLMGAWISYVDPQFLGGVLAFSDTFEGLSISNYVTLFVLLIGLLVIVLLFNWGAMRFDRFMLLNQDQGWLSSFSFRQNWGYFWRWWVMFLIQWLFLVAFVSLGWVFAGIFGASAYGPSLLTYDSIIEICSGLFGYYFVFRLAPALVSIALGRFEGFAAAWRATKGQGRLFWVLALVFAILNAASAWIYDIMGVIPQLIYWVGCTLYLAAVIAACYQHFFGEVGREIEEVFG